MLKLRQSRVIVQTEVFTEAVDVAPPAKDLRIIGVFASTYILVEYNDTLIMIDQHAAHERLNFENLKKRLDEGTGAQQLLVPYIVHLSRREAQLVMDSAELLEEAGYQVELFGDTDIQVRAVPFVLGQADMNIMFTEIIESLDTLKNAEKEKRMKTRMLENIV